MDFTNAVPRGNILRGGESVAAPVTPGPIHLNPPRTYEASQAPVRRGDVADVSRGDERNVGMAGTAIGTGAGVHRADATDATLRDDSVRDERLAPEPVGSRRIVDDPAADTGRPVRSRAVTGAPDHGRFSIGATFLGWAVASFFTLVFAGITLLALGAGAAQAGGNGLTGGDITTLSVAGVIGLLVSMFLAYLIGGYAAGRIAHWDGAKHGAVVPVWTIVFGLLGLLAGAMLGPQVAGYLAPFVPAVDAGALTTYGVLGILAMLVADFAGAILGGILGARGDQRHESGTVERRRFTRGRPL